MISAGGGRRAAPGARGAGRRRHLFGAGGHRADLELGVDRLALDLVAPALLLAALAAAGAAVGLGLGGALGTLVLGDQRLPVGDRDLIIVGMDFAEGEE